MQTHEGEDISSREVKKDTSKKASTMKILPKPITDDQLTKNSQ